jgi:RNA polymerase sigma factor for flagellar operon FliA
MGTTVGVDQYLAVSQGYALDDREALVMEHMPQVTIIARRIHSRLPSHYSLDDLISTGVVGLLEAINRYDPSMRIQLRTFAEHRIRGAILDSLRDLDWAPRDTRKKSRQIEAAIHAAKQRLAREPDEEEIARELGIELVDYQQWLGEVKSIEIEPLERLSRDGQDTSLLRFLPDDEGKSPARVVERSELERILTLAIERMPRMERTILTLYYLEELTLAQVSGIVGLHLSRVAELRAQGVLRLRSHLQRVWSRNKR